MRVRNWVSESEIRNSRIVRPACCIVPAASRFLPTADCLPPFAYFLLLSISVSFTGFPSPNFLVNQSSMSVRRPSISTWKLTSSTPSATGSVSSKASRPVKLRMQKLSNHAIGQARRPSSPATSTCIFLANTKTPLGTTLSGTVSAGLFSTTRPVQHDIRFQRHARIQEGRSVSDGGWLPEH